MIRMRGSCVLSRTPVTDAITRPAPPVRSGSSPFGEPEQLGGQEALSADRWMIPAALATSGSTPP